MSPSVLGSITLGYRPLWGRDRELAGIQLLIEAVPNAPVDAPHLLHTLTELGTLTTPPLLLSLQSVELLVDALEHAPTNTATLWIEVPQRWLEGDSVMEQRVRAAHARGLRMVWRGAFDSQPDASLAPCFTRQMHTLSPQAALSALQAAAALRANRAAGSTGQTVRTTGSPVTAGYIYEDIHSRPLMEHSLDQRDAFALLNWPDEDVLHAHRHQAIAPEHRTMLRIIKGLEADQSMEQIESIMGEEPVLAYRFLAHVNSAGIGLRTGISSLRHGLMMMGYGSLAKWLAAQLPKASNDSNMHPVKAAMVLRARLMEHLLDAGVEEGLRRDIYLCGLFSQLNLLMDEPLPTLLRRIPVSDRIYDANITHTGPYAAALDIACSQSRDDTAGIRATCAKHNMPMDEANRALLRTLVTLKVQPVVK